MILYYLLNIYLFQFLFGDLKYENIQFLYEVAMSSICPSAIESWGHYIDEARRAKSLIITLDTAPMNELVTENSGILILALKGSDLRTLIHNKYYPNKNSKQFDTFTASQLDMANGIVKALNMSTKERDTLCINAYNQSLNDALIFKKNMKNLLL